MLLPLAGRPMLNLLPDQVREVQELDGIRLVTNSRFAPIFDDLAPEDVTVRDDGRASNDDRLGAIGDMRFTVDACLRRGGARRCRRQPDRLLGA